MWTSFRRCASPSFGQAEQGAGVIIERNRLIHGGSGYYHIIHSVEQQDSLSLSLSSLAPPVVIYVSQIQIEHDSSLLRCPLPLPTFDPKRVSENESLEKNQKGVTGKHFDEGTISVSWIQHTHTGRDTHSRVLPSHWLNMLNNLCCITEVRYKKRHIIP